MTWYNIRKVELVMIGSKIIDVLFKTNRIESLDSRVE